MRDHDNEIVALKEEVSAIESLEQSFTAEQVKQGMDDLEWQCRKLNLYFHGIPESKDDLLMKLNEVAIKIDVPLLKTVGVVAMERLPAARDKIHGIIARFSRQAIKDSFMGKRHELLKLNDRSYILENLTKRTYALLTMKKEWAKDLGFKYVSRRQNKIFVRKTDGENAIAFWCARDLDSLG